MEEKTIKKKVISSAIWKFLERILAQMVSLVVSIILARLLSPDDYSAVSLVTVFFAFSNVFISSGFNTALIQKKDTDKLDYSTVLIFSIGISILIYIILFLLSPTIAKIYHRDELCDILRVMGLSLPITAIKSIWCAYISSNLEFRKFFIATIGGTIVSAIVGITMAYAGFGPWALVAQQMTNIIVDTIILIVITHVSFGFLFSTKRFIKLFGYGWKILVSSLVGTVYTQIVPLFIGIKYSNNDLSYYTKGKSFPDLITSTTTSTLSAVLFPFLSKYQDDKSRLLEYTRSYLRVSSYLTFPLMLGFIAIADRFVVLVLTEKWSFAIHYIKVFCVAGMFEMVHIGNCETIKAMGRSDIYLRIEIIKKIGYFITISIFLLATNNPETLSYAFIVCTCIALIVNSIPNQKLIGYKYYLQIQDLLPNLLISTAMAITVYLIGNSLFDNSMFTLFIQIILGISIYAILSIITKNRSFILLYSIIKSFNGIDGGNNEQE